MGKQIFDHFGCGVVAKIFILSQLTYSVVSEMSLFDGLFSFEMTRLRVGNYMVTEQ